MKIHFHKFLTSGSDALCDVLGAGPRNSSGGGGAGILQGGGGGGVRVQARGNFHILTSQKNNSGGGV